MGIYAIVKGEIVDNIVVANTPLNTDGMWICIDDVEPRPGPSWIYKDGVFTPPPVEPLPVLPPEKTEEEKIADATAAAIAKLIADGVLKQA